MEKIQIILLLIGLTSLLGCSMVLGERTGKRDFCQLSPERGRCKASQVRWHYDSSLGHCRNFTYGGCGGNSNKFATKTHCEIVCKPGCRHESCSTTCSHGFIIDADGCNTCRCQPSPDQASCPAVDCPTRCLHGYQTDFDGCMTCDCKGEPPQVREARTSPEHQCPPVCYMYCQYGNKHDENDCPVCACKSKEEACGSQQCMIECPTGFVTDSRGCELCECNPHAVQESSPRCSDTPFCTLYCTYGFKKGSDGCDICKCARRSAVRRLPRVERRFGRTRVSSEGVCGVKVMCMMHCEHGFQKDSKGCDTCTCWQGPPARRAQLPAGNTGDSPAQLPANVSSQVPALPVPANIPSQLPAEVPAQLPAEVPAQLPAISGCSTKRCHKIKSCAFGFAKDEDGCDTCVCSNYRSRATARRRDS